MYNPEKAKYLLQQKQIELVTANIIASDRKYYYILWMELCLEGKYYPISYHLFPFLKSVQDFIIHTKMEIVIFFGD